MPNLAIFYPNGQVEACQMYIWDGSKPILWDGSVTVSVTSSGTAIEDGVDNSIKATVRESSATAGKFGLAVINPDGSNIGAITGYATSAKQDTGNTSLASIDTKLTSPITVSGPLTDTQLRAIAVPISAAALPLPSGAATESTLSSLNSKVTAVNTGAVVLAAGSAIIGKVGIDQTTPGTTNKVSIGTDGTVALNAAIPAGTNLIGNVAGAEADDAAATKNPVISASVAKSPDGTDPGNVSAEGDVTQSISDLNRRQYVEVRHPTNTNIQLSGSTAYSNQSIASAPGAGFCIVVTNVIGSTGAATALNFYLDDGDGTKVLGPIYLEAVAGRGFCSGPISKRLVANKSLRLTSSASIAQSFAIEYEIWKV